MSEKSTVDDSIRIKMPQILKILLIDRTTSTPDKVRNIIWANDHYQDLDDVLYAPTAQIRQELITGDRSSLIMPRALKTLETQNQNIEESKYLDDNRLLLEILS